MRATCVFTVAALSVNRAASSAESPPSTTRGAGRGRWDHRRAAGVALHGYILPLMGHAAGTRLTPRIESVYQVLELVLLGLAGVAIAVLGAMLPAGWAARARTAGALRTE